MWAADAGDPAAPPLHGAEGVASVAQRSVESVRELLAAAATVVVVAHGDVLQILQASLVEMEGGASNHRRLPHLGTCVPRCLQRAGRAGPFEVVPLP